MVFKTRGKQLGRNFINDVIQTYGPEMVKSVSTYILRNEGSECMI